MKTNWTDYWFQGDKLVRDFETMYRDIEEPWLQRENLAVRAAPTRTVPPLAREDANPPIEK